MNNEEFYDGEAHNAAAQEAKYGATQEVMQEQFYEETAYYEAMQGCTIDDFPDEFYKEEIKNPRGQNL